MRKRVPAALFVVLAAALAAPAAAQGTGGFQFGLTGGASVPTGDTSNGFDSGWHGGLVLNYELPTLPLGIRLDGDYHNFSAKSVVPNVSGSAEILDGNANLVVGLRLAVLKVYALGGAGIYNVKLKAEAAGVSTSTSDTQFGWNAGAGLAFVAGKLSVFVEGRYHEVTLDNAAGGKFKFIPVTVGILF